MSQSVTSSLAAPINEAPTVPLRAPVDNFSTASGRAKAQDFAEIGRLAPRRVKFLCALLTGVLWWLAGQRMGWFALGWIALTPLFWALDGLGARARFKLGYLGGWFSYAFVNWWIIPTVTRAAPVIHLPNVIGLILGIIAVALIALIHGFGVALVALLWDTRGPLRRFLPLLPILVALAWALIDAARYETPLAHGWGALAYTQWRDVALLQSAWLLGQHGLSALCVGFAAFVALWLRRGDAWLWRLPVGVFVVLHTWGAWRLMQPVEAKHQLRVLLVQTNVPSLRKSVGIRGESPFEQALRLTNKACDEAQARGQGFDLIVWPETTAQRMWKPFASAPATRQGDWGAQMRTIDALCRRYNTSMLFGSQSGVGANGLFNDAILVGPRGEESSNAKNRLVPFGERAPFVEQLPFLGRLAPEPAVQHPTQLNTLCLPVDGETVKVGSVICFESCFRYPAKRLALNGARLLCVLTNDEWFTGSNAPWEHAALATLRAVENGVPLVQAANGGHCFVIDSRGRFVENEEHLQSPDLTPFGTPMAKSVVVPIA